MSTNWKYEKIIMFWDLKFLLTRTWYIIIAEVCCNSINPYEFWKNKVQQWYEWHLFVFLFESETKIWK
jgi:hypothetical protein